MNDLTLQVSSLFDSVSYDETANSWVFLFAENIWVQVAGFWRALKNNKIILVSLDHGHQFGLANPMDLVKELTSMLSGQKLLEISMDNHTADLALLLTDNIKTLLSD